MRSHFQFIVVGDVALSCLCSCARTPQCCVTTTIQNLPCPAISYQQYLYVILMQEVTSLGVTGYSSSSCPSTFHDRNLTKHQGSACWYATQQHWLNTEADNLVLGIDHTYKGSRYSPQPCKIRNAATGEVAAARFSGAQRTSCMHKQFHSLSFGSSTSHTVASLSAAHPHPPH